VDALEQDAWEVLRLVRSVKNTFAPINRIPQDIFSLIPGYCGNEEALITLTHVCRGWREQLISCSSLWTSLDCASADQTRVYLERSKTSPLDICLGGGGHPPFMNDAVPPDGPAPWPAQKPVHLRILERPRRTNQTLPPLSRAPSREIKNTLHPYQSPNHQDAIFNGDLSSLRELRISGALIPLPWKGLTNLTTFDFRRVPSHTVSVTQLLNFFEQTPVLRNATLHHAFPDTSDAPHGRIASLLHLKYFISPPGQDTPSSHVNLGISHFVCHRVPGCDIKKKEEFEFQMKPPEISTTRFVHLPRIVGWHRVGAGDFADACHSR
jgi:hypothetical protein